MHEFGAIDNVIKRVGWWDKLLYVSEGKSTRGAFTSGFYSMTTILELIYCILFGYYFYIPSYNSILDFDEYIKFLQDKKIEFINIAPHLYLKLINYDLPYLKQVNFSYDVNVGELRKKYLYSCSYGLTEAFGMLTSSYIDKCDDIMPAGLPCLPVDIKVKDDFDNELPIEKIGELCFVPEYFRGYINQPELTKKAYYNGYFHTGDLCYKKANGEYVVLGRKIDCLLTKNGYVVPSIISFWVRKKLPKITKSYVKIFGNEDSHKIVIYYCSDVEYSLKDFITALKGNIDDYMLPTHCVKMDDFEYFVCGKVKRLSFVEPRE